MIPANEQPRRSHPVSRRAVLAAGAKLAYAAPVVLASYHLHAFGADAAEGLVSGSVAELPTCTPRPGHKPTPPAKTTATPTRPAGGDHEPPEHEPPKTPVDDDKDEVLHVRFLPQTGDGGSLPPQGAAC